MVVKRRFYNWIAVLETVIFYKIILSSQRFLFEFHVVELFELLDKDDQYKINVIDILCIMLMKNWSIFDTVYLKIG